MLRHFLVGALLIFWGGAAMAQTDATPVEATPLSLEELRERYADDASRFITVDGVELHYKDEGSGFPVVLLHASYNSLVSWNYVAEALKDEYRIIRFDFPNNGLTSAETKQAPEGGFNLIERNVEVMEGLMDALELEKINLVATSSGGSVGFRYAAYHPDRVNRLVLINSAGMVRTAQTNPNRERPWLAQWADMTYRPLDFWQFTMGMNYPSLDAAPDWIVESVYQMNRRQQPEGPLPYFFDTGDPRRIVSEITAPTLILWGMMNPTVVHLEADVFAHWMTAAPTLVKKYPELGHYPYVEAPDQVIPDLKAFFAGDHDDALRQTVRARVAVEAR